MEYMSCPQAAKKWSISERRVQKLCEENRIPGVSKIGYMWLIPIDAEKPADGRQKNQKKFVRFLVRFSLLRSHIRKRSKKAGRNVPK